MRPVRVAYVAGAGRSGSTLLDCLVGELPEVFSCGEMTHLWRRGGVEDQLCGCGRPFSECDVWSAVVREAFGEAGSVDFRTLADLRDRVCTLVRLPQIASRALRSRAFADEVARYGEALRSVYRAVRTVTGCRVLVDSSKYPPEAFLLRELEGVEPTVLHIVRDSQAVAHAWRKWKVLPEVHWERRYYARYSPVRSAAGWSVFNALIEGLARSGVPYERIRYEDLVREPRRVLSRVARVLGLEEADPEFVESGEVRLSPNHTVSGNASRFRHGRVPLELDLEWKEEAPRLQRTVVGLLTWPGRRRYGYS